MKVIYKHMAFLCLFLIAGIFSVKADKEVISETFSEKTAPSGWTTTGSVSFGYNSNSKLCASLPSGASLTSPAIDQPVSLSFIFRTSGGTKELKVEKSINGGEWQTVGTANATTSWAPGSMNINAKGIDNVKIRFTAGYAIYLTDVKIIASEIGSAPTQQASISFGTVTGSTVTANLTAGNGVGRLLVYKKGSAVDFIPEAGISYEAGTALTNGNIVADAGNLSNVTIQGLEPGEIYYFSAFEYNGFEETANYFIPAATVNTRTLEVPSIILSSYNIKFGRLKTGTEDKREFYVSGKYLNPATGNITVTGNNDFQVSLDNAGYSTSVNIPYTLSALTSVKVYIKFAPTQLTDYTANITISGGNSDSQQLAVSGTGSDTDNKIYYLSPNGKDSNTGSYDSPWFGLQKAIDNMKPGDIVYVRGGEYKYPGTTFRIKTSGTADKRMNIIAYENEQPVFNFDQAQGTAEGDSKLRGIVHQGDYWYVYGIHLTKARDNGVKLEGSNNVYERCTFSYNGDTGLQLGFGHSFQDSHPGVSKNDGTYCANNYIIDCDSYMNYDWQASGGNADGFACKMHNGKDNWFIRCRAWYNSDDGWDLYETDFPVYIIECWAWHSAPTSLPKQGNGNGIKLGGNGTGGSSVGKHEAWNCVAFNCNKTSSVKGFDQNSHKGGVKVVNCLAYDNGYDFMFEKSSSETMEFYNNVCIGKQEMASPFVESNNALGAAASKGWQTATTGIGKADYVDLSETAAMAPRGTDGSLPTGFARLKEGSKLTGKAKSGLVPPTPNIGIKLKGTTLAPRYANTDLGPYDLKTSTGISQLIINPEARLNISVYPNPVKSDATLKFAANQNAEVNILVYDLQGRKVMDLGKQQIIEGADYYITENFEQLSAGIYMVKLIAGNEKAQTKLVITK